MKPGLGHIGHSCVPHPVAQLHKSLKRVRELHVFPVRCPGERWLRLFSLFFFLSALPSASSLWRMKWTVLVKNHFTPAKGAPRGVAVSPVDGTKWSQVSRGRLWAGRKQRAHVVLASRAQRQRTADTARGQGRGECVSSRSCTWSPHVFHFALVIVELRPHCVTHRGLKFQALLFLLPQFPE